jgi:hypothetical protein
MILGPTVSAGRPIRPISGGVGKAMSRAFVKLQIKIELVLVFSQLWCGAVDLG